MKKAIILMVHQMPEQINIFISQLLADKETDVYVHVSGKYSSIKAEIIKNDRVYICDKNIVINWGSDEYIKALIIMYREVLKAQKDYQYVLVATGQDLLVRKGLDDFLQKHNGEIFVECHNEPDMETHMKTRVFHRWPEIYRRKYDFKYHPLRLLRSLRYRMIMAGLPIGQKKLSPKVKAMKIYYSYVWYAIPFEVMEYVVSFVDNRPDFMELFSEGLFQSECFLATIIMQSKYKDRIAFEGYRSKSLTFLKEMDNMHPPILTMNDIKQIEESGFFFARKYDIRVDPEVVDYYKQLILSEGE